MFRVTFILLFLHIFSFLSLSVTAEQTELKKFVKGTHYEVLSNPLPVAVAPVMQFIYFGCRSCYQLTPAIANWSHNTGNSIALVPAHSETSMINEARMFHVFDEMGVLDRMYEVGYVMFQTDQSNLQGEARVNSFLSANNIDQEKFWSTWKSHSVNARLKASAELTRQAGVYKTPSFIVHGVYRIDIDSVKSVEELFELLDFLVDNPPRPETSPLRKAN